MIKYLQNINDPLIQKFYDDQLNPILKNNVYHSSEISETDEENQSSKRKVIIRDLRWHSTIISDCLIFIVILIL